jgi:alkanesulfonate monooxygenase SsuD/methylene tetrahydromethanopterin reductase-like flavin-dependent oxidoreductase (luciferase family)
VKFGYHTGYWSAGPPPGVADAIELTDWLGFDSIWTAEASGSDCLTPLAWWGAATTTVRLERTSCRSQPARQIADGSRRC